VTNDIAAVPQVLASALGIRGNPADALEAAIVYLEPREIMLVLDSCEHVLPAVSVFATKLASRRGRARMLTTSREPIATPGEYAIRIHPPAYPAATQKVTPGDLKRLPALELLSLRASEWSGQPIAPKDAATIADICRSLEGIPLAIS
jgi:predicted ATPase